MEKQCNKCLEIKTLSEFYPKKRGLLGVTSYCKKCFIKQVVTPKKPKPPMNYKDFLKQAGMLDYYKRTARYW